MKIEYADAVEAAELLFQAMFRRVPTEENVHSLSQQLRDSYKFSDVIKSLMDSDEYRTINKEKMFVPAGHFYSPIVNKAEAIDHLKNMGSRESAKLCDLEIDHLAMVALWESLLPYVQRFPFPDEQKSPYQYKVSNQAYGFGDSAVLFAMMSHFRPKRMIEIGSGWSSACAIDTAKYSLGGKCQFTFIDPYPQLVKELIGKDTLATIIESRVQTVDLNLFNQLEAGDILFIDSTHIVRTGSDVCFEIFEILPRLKPGVIVHIHDMFWPFEYPDQWIVDDNRSWNELYLVRAFLMNNEKWRVLYFNHYFATIETARLQKDCPRILENAGGGLWMINA